MRIIYDGLHDQLCATYQTLESARLNEVLKHVGIADQELRREICEKYFFDSGYFVDSCWFEEQNRRFRAGIYFAEVDVDGSETGDVHFPDPAVGTMFHEYAHGCCAWLFDDHNEDVSEIATGDIHSQ
jgi:hypothetical protein